MAGGQTVARPHDDMVGDMKKKVLYFHSLSSPWAYLGGPQFDAARMVYKLKFMDGSQVVVVYVDARTGRIVGRKP